MAGLVQQSDKIVVRSSGQRESIDSRLPTPYTSYLFVGLSVSSRGICVPRGVNSLTFSRARFIDCADMAIAPLITVMPRNFTSLDRPTLLFSRLIFNLSLPSINSLILSITRLAAFGDRTNILQSSAYRQNSRPRRSSSLSNSSSTTLLNNGLKGSPERFPLS